MRRLAVRSLVPLLACLATALLAPGLARAETLEAFKTPGEAAYCQMEISNGIFNAFRCFTPNDGWWIRFSSLNGRNVQVTKGTDDRYRGYRSSAFQLLPFGKTWWSSDASVVTCVSRSTGLTCKEYNGLTFWIGRYRGYRIYVSPAGEKPLIAKPLFRTTQGIYCGVGASMEPDAQYMICWRPTDGLELSLYHARGTKSGWTRNENAKGYRPSGYPLLGSRSTFTRRCQTVDPAFATGCSTSRGTTIFTCTSEPSRLTCRSDNTHGFWMTRSSFYNY
jgi:hypothetical protein